VGRKLPLDTPEATTYLRIAYVASQLIQFGVMYYVSMRIKAKNDLAMLKYVEPKAPGSSDPPAVVNTTVKDYDLAQVSTQMRSMLMGLAMIGFMHLYLKVKLSLGPAPDIPWLNPVSAVHSTREAKQPQPSSETNAPISSSSKASCPSRACSTTTWSRSTSWASPPPETLSGPSRLLLACLAAPAYKREPRVPLPYRDLIVSVCSATALLLRRPNGQRVLSKRTSSRPATDRLLASPL
jgi:hypothetical protein